MQSILCGDRLAAIIFGKRNKPQINLRRVVRSVFVVWCDERGRTQIVTNYEIS